MGHLEFDWIGFSEFIGAVGSIFVGIRWALGFYFKKAKEVEDLKAANRKREIEKINESIERLNSVTTQHTEKIQGFTAAIQTAYMRYNAQAESIKALGDQVREFFHEVKDDIKGLRTQVIELGRDVIILKARKTDQ